MAKRFLVGRQSLLLLPSNKNDCVKKKKRSSESVQGSCISSQPVYAVVDKDFFIGAVGLGFNSRAGQIGHSVANGLPLLQ